MVLRNPLFWLAAVVGLGLDQLTKLLVVQNFELTSPPQSVPLIPGILRFTYVTNTGAAWSLFSENGEWLRWLSLIVSLALVLYGLLARIPTRWEQVGYGLILSGAFGNGIDRLRSGEVVDFIQVFPITRFPVFNLADVWINIGIICLLLTILLVPEDSNGSKRRR